MTQDVISGVRARREARLHEYESLDAALYLFHPATGEPQVWYSGDPTGEIRFFSSPGSDPGTGRPLKQITKGLVEVYRESRRIAEERAALAQAQRAERGASQAEADLRAAEVSIAGHRRKFARAGGGGRRQSASYSRSRTGTNSRIISSLHSSDRNGITYGGKLANGERFYADRPYSIAGGPREYVGLPYVGLACDSKRTPITTTISVRVNQPVWVNIAWNHQVPPSPWLLSEYGNTGRRLFLAEQNLAYRIYRSIEPVTSGRIITYGQGASNNSFYLIFLEPL